MTSAIHELYKFPVQCTLLWGKIFRLHCPSPIYIFILFFSKGLRDDTMVEEGAKCSPGVQEAGIVNLVLEIMKSD